MGVAETLGVSVVDGGINVAVHAGTRRGDRDLSVRRNGP